jgi:FlaA1/EpsC-like NDP-sugar epimerase
VIGFMDDDLFAQGMRIYGANVIGRVKDIPQTVQKHDVGLILLADHRISNKEQQSIAKSCEGTSVRFAVVPDIFGSLRGLMEALPAIPLGDNGNGRDMSDFRCICCMMRYAPSDMESQVKE